MLCDPDGKVAICEKCGQIHSPYWSAAKSAALHRRGMAHKVKVMHAAQALKALRAAP
jgi:hypothetical protein